MQQGGTHAWLTQNHFSHPSGAGSLLEEAGPLRNKDLKMHLYTRDNWRFLTIPVLTQEWSTGRCSTNRLTCSIWKLEQLQSERLIGKVRLPVSDSGVAWLKLLIKLIICANIQQQIWVFLWQDKTSIQWGFLEFHHGWILKQNSHSYNTRSSLRLLARFKWKTELHTVHEHFLIVDLQLIMQGFYRSSLMDCGQC